MFSLLTIGYILKQVIFTIFDAKTNTELNKLTLWKWSAAYLILSIFVVICYMSVTFINQAYPIMDFILSILVLLSALCYINQWNANMSLFVRNRFNMMLTSKSVSNRLTYMARVMNIGKSMSKRCNDEASADKFVKTMQ